MLQDTPARPDYLPVSAEFVDRLVDTNKIATDFSSPYRTGSFPDKAYKFFRQFALSKGIGSNLLNEYDKYNNRMAYVDPYVIEERAMNITTLSVFSRLMLDRIIFIGSEINDEVANIVSAQLLWLEQQRYNNTYCKSWWKHI